MITEKSGVRIVAAAVVNALEDAGIQAVLTGGACASIYTLGRYQSVDLDFVLQDSVARSRLDSAMRTIGFQRRADRYVHPRSRLYVEFPRGPLAIGSEYKIRPVERYLGNRAIRMLSPTDSCRDRLAAFIHWRDRQSLRTAVMIALRNPVDLEKVRAWSNQEGFPEDFETFARALKRARKQRPRRTKTRPAVSH